ncbi:hypothetical protein, partial [Methanoregula sp.]|uniref:hypothetical protein n=1 Tax=Methanoregula sp. TaxID=2052170 RepID=UPI003BB16EB9
QLCPAQNRSIRNRTDFTDDSERNAQSCELSLICRNKKRMSRNRDLQGMQAPGWMRIFQVFLQKSASCAFIHPRVFLNGR